MEIILLWFRVCLIVNNLANLIAKNQAFLTDKLYSFLYNENSNKGLKN